MDNILDFLNQTEVLAILAAVLIVVADALYRRFRTTTVMQWQDFAAKLSPDQMDAIAVQVARRAYHAVEQLADVYGGMTSKQKQEQAIKFFVELFRLLYGAKPSKTAARAMLEDYARTQREAIPRVEVS